MFWSYVDSVDWLLACLVEYWAAYAPPYQTLMLWDGTVLLNARQMTYSNQWLLSLSLWYFLVIAAGYSWTQRHNIWTHLLMMILLLYLTHVCYCPLKQKHQYPFLSLPLERAPFLLVLFHDTYLHGDQSHELSSDYSFFHIHKHVFEMKSLESFAELTFCFCGTLHWQVNEVTGRSSQPPWVVSTSGGDVTTSACRSPDMWVHEAEFLSSSCKNDITTHKEMFILLHTLQAHVDCLSCGLAGKQMASHSYTLH